MKEIGGYFELELHKGEHYHPDALRLNTGRNCFEYILRAKGYKKVYIPYYTCEVMLEPLRKCGVKWEFYHIDEDFEPLTSYSLANNEAFLYTNYWGLKQACVKRLSERYGKQLIVDNAQAFFASPIEGVDTFYSARKFFGVPDGAYLYIDKIAVSPMSVEISASRISHLFKRMEREAETGYQDFQHNENSLSNLPIRQMSAISDRILQNVDYEYVRYKRRENFSYLHAVLKDINWLKLNLEGDIVPMIYPFWSPDRTLRKRLIENRIYVATYWPNVLKWCKEHILENNWTQYLISLPVDQRYGPHEMEQILKIILA